jgi:hypothetical protein
MIVVGYENSMTESLELSVFVYFWRSLFLAIAWSL